MNHRKHTPPPGLFRGLASSFLALAVLVGSANSIALTWESKVNELLGVSGSSIEYSDSEADYYYISDFSNASDLIQGEIDLNTRLEEEGAVLLKGSAAVNGTGVTLFGLRSESMQYGGSMGALTAKAEVISLTEALESRGFSVNPTITAFYEEMSDIYTPGTAAGVNVVDEPTGATVNEVPISEYDSSLADSYSSYRDAAIIVLGRDSGEGTAYYPGADGIDNADEFSTSETGNILGLSDDEKDLIAYVTAQGFDQVIVLLNTTSTMEVQELQDNDAITGILWIGDPGAYGTYGIADILAGNTIPSGHLSDTYAMDTSLSPAMVNYGIYLFENEDELDTTSNNALRNSWYLVETESIYIGYKYYETRYYDSVVGSGMASLALHYETADGSMNWDYDNEVTYAFGYGIEGSTFSEEIIDSSIDWTGESDSTVTVRVTNTGATACKHVVQLYVSQPYTDYDVENGIEKSAIQLVGYGKAGESSEADYTESVLLEPGDSEDVVITFNAQDFISYDMTYEHDGVTGAYLFEAGDYYFVTGNGSHDAVQLVLKPQYPDSPTGTALVETLDADISITESNGTLIQNQLGDADLNSYDCGVTVSYLTRSDWAGSWPTSVDSLTATEEMITLLQNEIYEEDTTVKDIDYVYEADNGLAACELVGLDYDDPAYDTLMEEVSLESMVNLFLASVRDNESIVMPQYIGSDSPSGMIATIGQYTEGTIFEVSEDDASYGHYTNVYVNENVVASTFSPLLAYEEGRMIGNDSLWTGVTAWNAPGLNIHRIPYNARNNEYYSEDAVLTGNMGAAVIQGVQKYGVVVYAKHFAFNDAEINRDGLAVFLSEQAGRENELRGLRIALEESNASGLMTSFNRVGCTHASASKGLMAGILRGEWGFDGYVITDSLKSAQYFLPSECLVVGTDQMLGGSNSGTTWSYTAEAIAENPELEEAIREAYHRYLYTYINSNVMNGITADTSTGMGPAWQVALTAGTWSAAALAGLFALLWLVFRQKSKRQRQEGETV
ncbi:MAG: glycoside hydrolase family 3 C-terminal domain-containing protein [Clostridiales bacterium]|nr:glycoside hydrolase family 3 C-terminal domain-containing protein [Clostridiales bacterium]